MFDKLTATERQYETLAQLLGSAEVQSDPSEYRKHAKALSEIEPLVERFREFKTVAQDIAQTEELASAGDRSQRTRPYVHRDRGRPSRSRRGRRSDQRKGSARRHLLLERARRPEREHDIFRRAPHPHPDRRRRLAAGREVANQESREGDE